MSKIYNMVCQKCCDKFQSHTNAVKFCEKCYLEIRTRFCLFCGKKFIIEQPHMKNKFCSQSCGTKHQLQNETTEQYERRNKKIRESILNKSPEQKADSERRRKENFYKTLANTPKDKKEKRYKKVSESLKKFHKDKQPEYYENKIEKFKKSYFSKTFEEAENMRIKQIESRGNITNPQDLTKNKITEIFQIKDNFIDFPTRFKIKEYFNFTNISNMKASLEKMGFLVKKHTHQSSGELFVKEYILENFNFKIEEKYIFTKSPKNSKFNLEIDIFIPELKLGIEYNGSYWHDGAEYFEGLTKEEYKTRECEKLGITLHHIWDYENIEDRLNEIFKDYL